MGNKLNSEASFIKRVGFKHCNRSMLFLWVFVGSVLWLSMTTSCQSQDQIDPVITAERALHQYFENETDRLTRDCLNNIITLSDWEEEKQQRRSELLEMLGLQPFPEKTPLNPIITGGAEADEVVVENLYFESAPGLFVTANLYRPKKQEEPLPAILYVCGHGRVKKNGISFGNKTHYQHHGAWFARNGYVCLTIDTIQLGELEGIHHGTYREKMWWWNNRGYTPAGVEAWNCIRSLDYLQSRPEVDGDRIGVTGRSGGGAYSWWIAAIDERIKAAVPVAGITSMKNHVVDGCIEGHCDCMFMLNTYRWDYPMVAALVAPRPLLISNTDKDRIFPLDGVVDVYRKASGIYKLYNASDKIGLHITEGPHQDTQELRIHAFRWLNRHLRGTDELIDLPATKLFTPEQLRVFKQLPENQRVTDIHESFVPVAPNGSVPRSVETLKTLAHQWQTELEEKTFAGWNPQAIQVNAQKKTLQNGIQIQKLNYKTDHSFDLTLYHLSLSSSKTRKAQIHVLNHSEWTEFEPIFSDPGSISKAPNPSNTDRKIAAILEDLRSHQLILVLPRGIGPSHWKADEKTQTHIRRRFMQLGQTLAGMQVFDVIQAIEAIRSLPKMSNTTLTLHASGEAATWALYASIFTAEFDGLFLSDLPPSHRESPDLLNVSRIANLPQLALLAGWRNQHLQLKMSEGSRYRQWLEWVSGNDLASDFISVEAKQPE